MATGDLDALLEQFGALMGALERMGSGTRGRIDAVLEELGAVRRSIGTVISRLSDIELGLIRLVSKTDTHEARIDDHDQQLGDIRRRLETLESAPVTKGT